MTNKQRVVVNRKNYKGPDETYEVCFVCPNCDSDEIHEGNNYCSNCGVEITWFGDYNNDDA